MNWGVAFDGPTRAILDGFLVTNVWVTRQRPSFEIIPRFRPYVAFRFAGHRARLSFRVPKEVSAGGVELPT